MSVISNIKKRILLKKIYRLLKTRHYDEAVSVIGDLPDNRIDEDIYYALSLAYFAMDDMEKSLEAIEKSISIEDKNPAFLVHKAKIYQKQKRYEESIELLESSQKLTIFNEEILYIQAINYLARNDINRANELFYDSLKTIDKRFIESRFAMAVELFLLRLQEKNSKEKTNN